MTAVEFCGDGMDNWSDRAGGSNALTLHAARMLPPRANSVLLLGARAAVLAGSLLAGGREVTAIVRGQADAESLAAAGARAICGAVTNWTPDRQYDAVVVLDTPATLLPDASRGIGHLELVERVRSWAPTSIVYVENGGGLAAVDAASRPVPQHREGDDLRAPTSAELSHWRMRPAAAVYCGSDTVEAVIDPEAVSVVDPGPRTVLRSLLSDDLRWDALIDAPVVNATGWLIAQGTAEVSVSWHRLDGTVSFALPTTAFGTPVETEVRRLLVAGDEQRLRALLQTVAADGNEIPLLRNLVRTREGLAPIDRTAPTASLPLVMLDVATPIAGRPQTHPFDAALDRVDLAGVLLHLATGDDRARDAAAAALGDYEQAPYARTPAEQASAPSADQDERASETTTSAIESADFTSQIAALHAELEAERRRSAQLQQALADTEQQAAKRGLRSITTSSAAKVTEAARRRMGR